VVSRLGCLLLLALALTGCGDADKLRSDAREKVAEVRREAKQLRTRAERLRDRLADRVRETLDQIKQAIPAAGINTRPPTRGDATMEQFLTEVIKDVDGYWTKTLRAAGLREPRVSYVWLPRGARQGTGCGHAADDSAAFYCPSDDTIYVAEAFAQQILDGGGDFGLAYVLAHEYAHNIQQELGWFTEGRQVAVKPFELQADCMAGSWGNSVYRRGRLKQGDVEEAMRTAYAVGDFDRLNPQHHGTPTERRDAWLRGYRSGDPSVCQAYVPT
jgi:predicted metalloprotease